MPQDQVQEQHLQSKMDRDNHAIARGLDLPISTKHSIEICNFIRYKQISRAQKQLNLVLQKRLAIPLTRFHKDRGHRKGKIGPGFYPLKAAKEILALLKLLEANAQNKGLNSEILFLKTVKANKASRPIHHGRRRRSMKRTHIEMIAGEKELPIKKKETIPKEKLNQEDKKIEEKKENKND